MSQNEMILNYMKQNDGISTYKAFEMKITRLAARISELRDKGYHIDSEKRISEIDGKKKNYVFYRLIDK